MKDTLGEKINYKKKIINTNKENKNKREIPVEY